MSENIDFSVGLSVVLPAFNEEANITGTLEALFTSLRSMVQEYEVIVVDDGSSDRTAPIVAAMQADNPELRLVCHPHNRGYGAALRSGFDAASQDLIFFMDSDGQFLAEEIRLFLEQASQFDMVIGYRKNRQDPFWRRANSLLGNALARSMLGVRVRDINCAFKLFHKRKLRSLPLESSGAFINTELLALAEANAWTSKEIAVTHLPRLAGKPTGGDPLVIIKTFQEYFQLSKKLRQFHAKQVNEF